MKIHSIELSVTLTREQYTKVMAALSSLKKGSEYEYEVIVNPRVILGMPAGYSLNLSTNNSEIAILVLQAKKN